MKCVSWVIRKSHFIFSITEKNKVQFYHIIVSGNFLRLIIEIASFNDFRTVVSFYIVLEASSFLMFSWNIKREDLWLTFGWPFVLKIEFQRLKVIDKPCKSMFIGIVSGVKEGCVCCKLSLSLAFTIFVQTRPDYLFPNWQLHVQS